MSSDLGERERKREKDNSKKISLSGEKKHIVKGV